MPRYKDYHYDQVTLLPGSYARQILPGTFEFTLNHVIDEIDLAGFDAIETTPPAPRPTIRAYC